MFKKGPPENEGFMWCSKEGGQGLYWSEEETGALKMVSGLVLDYQWDSSEYSIMLHAIPIEICLKTNNKKPNNEN